MRTLTELELFELNGGGVKWSGAVAGCAAMFAESAEIWGATAAINPLLGGSLAAGSCLFGGFVGYNIAR